eukprot:TRINITY_DN3416_c0_g1_i1.p1 TRINITY_DN3416_c0_g1~~TRINITY_DN3416_c0_g1_i1.p1  ORF type:complete len:292 (+),score=47.14 TRINITY_DN3416_c0_g1_i1:2764-3639(+)
MFKFQFSLLYRSSTWSQCFDRESREQTMSEYKNNYEKWLKCISQIIEYYHTIINTPPQEKNQMEGKMSRERKLVKGMAKRARDFFQSLADLMKGYLADVPEEIKEIPASKKSYSKKVYKKQQEIPGKKKYKKAAAVKKPEKDPDAPKKPLPAFLLFSNTKRRQMKESGVSKAFTVKVILALPLKDRLAQIETEWARMSKAEKDVISIKDSQLQEWYEKANKAKEKYAQEMEEYNKRKGLSQTNAREEEKAPTREQNRRGEPKGEKEGDVTISSHSDVEEVENLPANVQIIF